MSETLFSELDLVKCVFYALTDNMALGNVSMSGFSNVFRQSYSVYTFGGNHP